MAKSGTMPYSSYYEKVSPVRIAVVDLSPIYEGDMPELGVGWLINRVNTPQEYRRQGTATRLMNRVIADADAEGVTLFLEVAASGEMNNDQLRCWYKGFGFECVIGDAAKWGPVMKREPRI